jgi:hypothetical protein
MLLPKEPPNQPTTKMAGQPGDQTNLALAIKAPC